MWDQIEPFPPSQCTHTHYTHPASLHRFSMLYTDYRKRKLAQNEPSPHASAQCCSADSLEQGTLFLFNHDGTPKTIPLKQLEHVAILSSPSWNISHPAGTSLTQLEHLSPCWNISHPSGTSLTLLEHLSPCWNISHPAGPSLTQLEHLLPCWNMLHSLSPSWNMFYPPPRLFWPMLWGWRDGIVGGELTGGLSQQILAAIISHHGTHRHPGTNTTIPPQSPKQNYKTATSIQQPHNNHYNSTAMTFYTK